MLVLALDSTTRAGSVALALDGVVLDARVGEAAVRHAARLPGDLVDLLAAHGYGLRDVDLLAVASGPGGFTGLRVGLATVQGLALALDRRVFIASTLDLLAQGTHDDATGEPWIGAWMHGMRGEVFTALYRSRAGSPSPVAMGEAFVGAPEAAADSWAPDGSGAIAVTGDAWPALAAPVIARFEGRLVGRPSGALAGTLARLATRRADEAVGPAAVRPTYVRRPDAVVTRLQAGLPVTGDL